MRSTVLLTIDAVINLGLGGFLLIFPQDLIAALGLPVPDGKFYPSLLGAVLLGIGVALLIPRWRQADGLGLLGAMSINLSGGIALAAWLIFGQLNLPLHGVLLLWALVLILIGISALELAGLRSSAGGTED